MNIESAVYVFRRSDESPTIFAYKRVHQLYLTCVFTGRRVFVFWTRYSDIVDVVPIRAICLCTNLRLYPSLSTTLVEWRQEILMRMQTFGEMSAIGTKRPREFLPDL